MSTGPSDPPESPGGPQDRSYWPTGGQPPGSPPLSSAGAPTPTTKSHDERKAILAQHVQMATARGRRVESQMDYQAVLVQGKPINHTLHAILTIFTCLMWGIAWIVLAVTAGEKREMVVVDEWGNVQYQSLGRV